MTLDVVRRLVDDQFPRWRNLPVREVASDGTVNAIYRIGDGLAARFPLPSQAPADARAMLEREASAYRELADSATSSPATSSFEAVGS